jgi:hypothetical protein
MAKQAKKLPKLIKQWKFIRLVRTGDDYLAFERLSEDGLGKECWVPTADSAPEWVDDLAQEIEETEAAE